MSVKILFTEEGLKKDVRKLPDVTLLKMREEFSSQLDKEVAAFVSDESDNEKEMAALTKALEILTKEIKLRGAA
jgi:hypothetical protein